MGVVGWGGGLCSLLMAEGKLVAGPCAVTLTVSHERGGLLRYLVNYIDSHNDSAMVDRGSVSPGWFRLEP